MSVEYIRSVVWTERTLAQRTSDVSPGHVCGYWELLVKGLFCDMGPPRFQQINAAQSTQRVKKRINNQPANQQANQHMQINTCEST